jgi:fumarylacetoacetase
MIDATHDVALACWVPGAQGHQDFPVQNLPLGVFSLSGDAPRIATRIGDHVLDLARIAGALPASVRDAVQAPTLNALFALPAAARTGLRAALSRLLTDVAQRDALSPHLHPVVDATMHLPCAIGDYTDFYVGIHHATNIGKQFRPDNPLLPNYKYLPIGYHGRASSIRVSGTDLVRPSGQRKRPDDAEPVYGPARRLDYELELGVWIGAGNALGETIAISDAGRHIAGFGLLNDWSARDLQAWEYQPLGPFLAKNFASTVSPWVVTADALAPYRIAQPPRPAGDPAPLPYLFDANDQASGAFDLTLSVAITTPAMRAAGDDPFRLGEGPAANMYWTVAQLVTHHASNGCNLMPGDLLGTGTISTPDDTGLGSLIELTRGGTAPLTLPTGETRTFLEDGDEIVMTARAARPGVAPVGFGECRATVIPRAGLANSRAVSATEADANR